MRKTILTAVAATAFAVVPAGAAMADTATPSPSTSVTTTTTTTESDKTGLLNIVVSKGCWAHHRRVVRTAAALLVRGRLERVDGVVDGAGGGLLSESGRRSGWPWWPGSRWHAWRGRRDAGRPPACP